MIFPFAFRAIMARVPDELPGEDLQSPLKADQTSNVRVAEMELAVSVDSANRKGGED